MGIVTGLNMASMAEDLPNFFSGMQILGFRDMPFMESYFETLHTNPEDLKNLIKYLSNGGYSIIDMEIVIRDSNGDFKLNPDFGDYESWQFSEENVINNCKFLKGIKSWKQIF